MSIVDLIHIFIDNTLDCSIYKFWCTSAMSFSSDVFKVALYLLGCVFTLEFMIWQNHNYAVDPASCPEGVEVTHANLNDWSCAGQAYSALNIMSLQYHPEASPGPHD